MRFSRLVTTLLAVAMIAGACSGGEGSPTTTRLPTTTAPPSTTVSEPPTTLSPTTTTTRPVLEVAIGGDLPAGMSAPLEALYSWLADDRNPEPAIPSGLIEHLAPISGTPTDRTASATTATLANGDQVAVAHVDDDIVLLVDEGDGWRVVGADVAATTPWYGKSPRLVLILGSDARVGQNQQRYRADSVHLLSVVPETGEGAIVGFPRDSWVDGPNGGIKLTSLMAGRGPEIMLSTITDLSDLPIEGYFVTGFKGFDALIKALGGLVIDLPTRMRSGNNWANYAAGLQKLTPMLTLRLARIRKGLPRGDFDRSVNQGRIMLAAMDMVQPMGIDLLPNWLRILTDNTWTDLSTEDLLTLGASAYAVGSDKMANVVLPGKVGRAGKASVVYLDEAGIDAIFRDLEDGTLEPAD